MIQAQEKFMQAAIEQALLAKQDGDYPVGAVLVIGNEIVSAWGNRVKRDESPVAHAELLAILDASQKLKSRHLINAILYTTHEPCPMCAGLCIFARLKGVVYGARGEDMKEYALQNPTNSYLWRTTDIPCEEILGRAIENIDVVKDVMRKECIALFNE